MKRIITAILMCACYFSFSLLPVSASDDIIVTPVSFSVNEYDIIMTQKQNKNTSMSFSDNTEINSYEQLYLERARLSPLELIEVHGYTEEQVQILKEYTGTPIEETPELRRASASCSGYVYGQNCSKTSLGIVAEWNWSSTPVLAGAAIHDKVALRWSGTDTGGNPLNLACTSKSLQTKYVGNGGVSTYNSTPSLVLPYGAVEGDIQMERGFGTVMRTAKSGTLRLTLSRTGSKSIKEAGITFIYAHASIGFNISLSYPAGAGISVSTGATKMFNETVRVTSSGQTLG